MGANDRHPEHTQKRFTNPDLTKEEVLKGMREFIEGAQKQDLSDWYEDSYGTSKFLLNAWARFVLPYKWCDSGGNSRKGK